MKVISLFLGLLLLNGAVAVASEGKLPRGKGGSTPGSKIVIPERKDATSCRNFLASLPFQSGFFS